MKYEFTYWKQKAFVDFDIREENPSYIPFTLM